MKWEIYYNGLGTEIHITSRLYQPYYDGRAYCSYDGLYHWSVDFCYRLMTRSGCSSLEEAKNMVEQCIINDMNNRIFILRDLLHEATK